MHEIESEIMRPAKGRCTWSDEGISIGRGLKSRTRQNSAEPKMKISQKKQRRKKQLNCNRERNNVDTGPEAEWMATWMAKEGRRRRETKRSPAGEAMKKAPVHGKKLGAEPSRQQNKDTTSREKDRKGDASQARRAKNNTLE